jgi:hypothetical protein
VGLWVCVCVAPAVAASDRGRTCCLSAAIGQRGWAEVTAILDRLLVLGCVYLRLGADSQAREVLDIFRRTFEFGFDESDVGARCDGRLVAAPLARDDRPR